MARATWLVDVLREAGLVVRPYSGWTTRGGSTFDPRGVMLHHTVTNPDTSDWLVDRMLAETGSSRVSPPLANWSTNRDGSVSVIAAGIANHGGQGTWNGISGNRFWFGDEMKNRGTGVEPWPARQVESALRAAAAVLAHIGADESWLCGHKEYATPPGRKVDPHSLNMNTLRTVVAELMEDPDMRQPSWLGNEVLARLAQFNIVPREDESEDMWRFLAFLDRMASRLGGTSVHDHDGRYIKNVTVSK